VKIDEAGHMRRLVKFHGASSQYRVPFRSWRTRCDKAADATRMQVSGASYARRGAWHSTPDKPGLLRQKRR
jgi:hypothetical protein